GNLLHLRVESLAHFRAAVVHLDAPVAVDEDQRAGLIEERRRERNAELHGRDGKAALLMFVRRVEPRDLIAPAPVLARLLQLRPDGFDAARALDPPTVMRRVALPIEVAP